MQSSYVLIQGLQTKSLIIRIKIMVQCIERLTRGKRDHSWACRSAINACVVQDRLLFGPEYKRIWGENEGAS